MKIYAISLIVCSFLATIHCSLEHNKQFVVLAITFRLLLFDCIFFRSDSEGCKNSMGKQITFLRKEEIRCLAFYGFRTTGANFARH